MYFARDASYSVSYTGVGSGDRFMYLALVLVGQYCTGNSGMRTPPPKKPYSPEILYESVVDNTENPTIFVVFNNTQCYPQYIITFQKNDFNAGVGWVPMGRGAATAITPQGGRTPTGQPTRNPATSLPRAQPPTIAPVSLSQLLSGSKMNKPPKQKKEKPGRWGRP